MNPNRFSKKLLAVVSGFVGLCFIACSILMLWIYISQQNPKYGREFNSERKKRGIPVIPGGWHSLVQSKGDILWSDPNDYWNSDPGWGDGAVPMQPNYSMKKVVIKDENTIKETDMYFGSNILEIKGDAAVRERVLITCTYHLDNIKDVTCTADIYTRDMTFTNGDVGKAKSILKKWGLSYP